MLIGWAFGLQWISRLGEVALCSSAVGSSVNFLFTVNLVALEDVFITRFNHRMFLIQIRMLQSIESIMLVCWTFGSHWISRLGKVLVWQFS